MEKLKTDYSFIKRRAKKTLYFILIIYIFAMFLFLYLNSEPTSYIMISCVFIFLSLISIYDFIFAGTNRWSSNETIECSNDNIFITQNGTKHSIKINEIEFIQIEGEYVSVYKKNKILALISFSLRDHSVDDFSQFIRSNTQVKIELVRDDSFKLRKKEKRKKIKRHLDPNVIFADLTKILKNKNTFITFFVFFSILITFLLILYHFSLTNKIDMKFVILFLLLCFQLFYGIFIFNKRDNDV